MSAKIKQLFLVIFFYILSINTYSQVTTFSKTIDIAGGGGLFLDTGKKIISLADSSLVIYAYGSKKDEIYTYLHVPTLSKLDSKGNIIWTQAYEHPNPPTAMLPASPHGVFAIDNKDFLITGGTRTDSTNEDFF